MKLSRLGKVALLACLCVFNVNALSNPLNEYQVYEKDVDGDGDIDYLLKLSPEDVEIPYDIDIQIERSAQQYLLTQNADGSFSVTEATLNSNDWTLIEADIDEINYLDGGELEIAIRTYGSDPQVIIASQSSEGVLSVANSLAAQALANGATASILDINNDGQDDVVVSGDGINTLSAGSVSLKHDAVQNFAPKTWAGQDGAAHASIEIFMPKELGPVPGISLQYSSNAGNGTLGMGFNLAGVSKIHYCKPSADVGHTMAATPFTEEERLCLDGQYLVQTSGASRFANDATYMTEISNSSRIRYKNSSSENTFVVEVKGGGKLIYSHARKHDQNTSQTIEWYLKRAEDEFGNGYDYTYKYATSHQYQPLLEKIEYGTVSVDLTWEARANKASQSDSSKSTTYNDEYLGHKGGSTTIIRDRLSRINVQRNAKSLRSYDLKYGANHNGQSQLENVEVCSLNTKCAESNFDWFEGQAVFQAPTLLGSFSDKEPEQKAQFLDVNGDGFTDVMYPSTSGTWKFRLGSKDGFGAIQNTGVTDGTGAYADYATPITLGLDHIQGLIIADTTYDAATDTGAVLACVDSANDFYVFSDNAVFDAATTPGSLSCSVSRPGKTITGTLQYMAMTQWYMLHATYNGSTLVSFEKSELVQTFGNRLYPADINNDGRQDLVVKYEYGFVDYLYREAGIAKASDPVDYAYGELLSVYVSEYEVTGENQSNIDFRDAMVTWPQIANDYDGTFSFSDFNHDGILDLEKCSEYTGNNSCDQYTLGFNRDLFEEHLACPDRVDNETPAQKDARLACQKENWFITANEQGAIQPSNKKTKQISYYDDGKKATVTKNLYSPNYYSDFNGDGITDRMQLTSNGMEVRFNRGNPSNTSSGYYSKNFPSVTGDPFRVRLLDFNGDGLTDILAEDNGELKLYQAKRAQNTVNGYSDHSRSIEYQIVQAFTDGSMPINSFAGVDMDEMFVSSKSVTGFGNTVFRHLPVLQYKDMPTPMDYNGDGVTDLVYFSGSNLYVTRRQTGHASTNKLQSISDSFSNSTQFTYKNSQLTPNTDFDDVRFPYVNIANTTGVLASMKYGNTQNGFRTSNYEYQGAQYHLQGRGFMGYGKRTVTDVEKGITTEESYKQQFPFAGAVASSESYQAADPAKKLASNSNTWSQKTLSLFDDQIILPYVNSSWSKSYGLNGIATSFSFISQAFDDFANLTNKITRIGSGSSSLINISTTALNTVSETYNYQHGSSASYVQNEIDNWRIALPIQSTVTSTQGSDTKTIITTYTPKDDTHLIASKSDFSGTTEQLDHTYSYNTNGQLLSEKLSSSAGTHTIESRTAFTNSNFQFGYLPSRMINATGQAATVEYHSTWHQPKTQTNVQGLTQTIDYDDWGKAYKTINSDGVISLSLSNVCTTQCPTGAYYSSTQLQMHKSQTGFLAPPQISYFDALSRVLREESKNAIGEKIFQDYQYDLYGRLTHSSNPYIAGKSIQWTQYENYDLFDRPLNINQANGGAVSQSYVAATTGTTATKTITNKRPDDTHSKQTSSQITNALGQVTQVVNNQSGLTNTYVYDAFSQLRTAIIYEGANFKKSVSASYNIAGLKTQINDPDTGVYTYEFDALGLMRKQNDSRGNEYIYSYDKLNQKTQQTLNGQLDASWVYSSSVPGLLEKRFKANFNESYEYDTKHRIKQVSTQLNTLAARQFKYTYDAAGRTQNTIYPSGFEVNALYNPSGFLTAYQNPKNQKNYWQAEDMDAFGNWTGERFGNDIQIQRNYDLASGLLETITSTKTANGDVQNLSYAWDTSGNLHSRSDANLSTSETFNYDGVNRLTSATTTGLASGDRTLSYAYDALGNMTHKSDLSDVNGMAYGTQNGTGANAGPSRLLSVTKNSALLFSYQYDANGNMTKRGNVNAAYTPANKPSRIWSGSPQIAGYVENSFLYDTDEQRFYQQQKQGFNTVRETYYYGAGYEEIFDVDPATQVKTHKQKAYVGGVMIHSFTQSDALVNGGKITDIQYLHHDHLGSTQAITNASGEVLRSLAFDPFGKARQSNWEDAQTTPSKNPDWASIALNHTSQGFTGHEMLADFDLIHMGGRLYDPIAGRMMSADPFIQAPYFGQSYNRYSYAWNNPLSNTDPTGYLTALSDTDLAHHNISNQNFQNDLNALADSINKSTNQMLADMQNGSHQSDIADVVRKNQLNAIAEIQKGNSGGSKVTVSAPGKSPASVSVANISTDSVSIASNSNQDGCSGTLVCGWESITGVGDEYGIPLNVASSIAGAATLGLVDGGRIMTGSGSRIPISPITPGVNVSQFNKAMMWSGVFEVTGRVFGAMGGGLSFIGMLDSVNNENYGALGKNSVDLMIGMMMMKTPGWPSLVVGSTALTLNHFAHSGDK